MTDTGFVGSRRWPRPVRRMYEGGSTSSFSQHEGCEEEKRNACQPNLSQPTRLA